MKAPKLPPPEIVPETLVYIGYWYGHTIYKDVRSENRCKYVCSIGGVWYRSPSIRDLLTIPLENIRQEPTRKDQVLFCLSAIDRLLMDFSEIKPQIRNLLLELQIILTELKNEE